MDKVSRGRCACRYLVAVGGLPMWCAACQLDAPALAVPEEPGVIRCAFCGGELGRGQESGVRSQESGGRKEESGDRGQGTEEREQIAAVEEAPALLAFVPPPAIDEWA